MVLSFPKSKAVWERCSLEGLRAVSVSLSLEQETAETRSRANKPTAKRHFFIMCL